jgi:hypothetical protein
MAGSSFQPPPRLGQIGGRDPDGRSAGDQIGLVRLKETKRRRQGLRLVQAGAQVLGRKRSARPSSASVQPSAWSAIAASFVGSSAIF